VARFGGIVKKTKWVDMELSIGFQNSELSEHQELRTQNSELRTQNSELRTQNSELRTQNSELRTQNSELRTQNPESSHDRHPPPNR
jgi:regulator of replication initiation timing